jgi:hypothetical protein
MRANHK